MRCYSECDLSLGFPHQNPVWKSRPVPHGPPILFLLDWITRIIFCEKSLPLCIVFQCPVTSSSLGRSIMISTLFSNTLSLRSSLTVKDQVSHPHKGTRKIRVIYILTFTLVNSKSSIQSGLNYFTHLIFIYGCPSNIFKICHIFNEFMNSL
jgi:hypothetical protein